jgi:pimeloyl-[acyl-carrier protein] methyl ester esterase
VSTLPLVLLHGWGLSPRVWAGLRDALPEGLVVHAPELPGHGAAAPAATATLAAWGEHLLATMPTRAVLCGWSLGGLIAVELALRHPQRFERLVLLDTSPCFVARDACDDQGAWPHGLAAATVQAFIDGFATDPAATLRRFVALQTVGDARRSALGAALSAALTDCGGARQSALADGLVVLATSDLRARIAGLRQPVTLIHGAADALMPVDAARWLARQWPAAKLHVVDGCGHAPFVSQPAACAAMIAESLGDA